MDKLTPRYWLVVGSVANWHTAFEHGNIWGLKETQKHLWEGLEEHDVLLFYTTTPVRGIIGFGRVQTKFRQNQPLWPQELLEARVIWPLRFEFDVISCLPPAKWKTERLASKELFPRAGFQPLNPNLAEQLISLISAFKTGTQPSKPSISAEAPAHYQLSIEKPEGVSLSHDLIKNALVEIGRLQNFIAESEYPFDIGRLDVVWRRVQQSVPTYVYEVQMGGNLHQALSKLKHAYDLWNSRLFLVSPREQFGKAHQLLLGTFHEVRGRLKILDCLQVEELLNRKKSYHDLERELGILE